MEKIFDKGTEVLIVKFISGWGIDQGLEYYIRGTIIKRDREEVSPYNDSWVTCYTVLGEDGKEYFGNYGNRSIGSYFFITEEDYVSYLNKKIELNKSKINEIENENTTFEEMINNVNIRGKQRVLSNQNINI